MGKNVVNQRWEWNQKEKYNRPKNKKTVQVIQMTTERHTYKNDARTGGW